MEFLSPITPLLPSSSIEWLNELEFKMSPVLFKKSWNLFYSNDVECPVKIACFFKKII